MTLRESGELIGDCGLTLQNIHGELLPEIGYHIRRDRQRQGYAAEAAGACRDWAFAHTPFRQLFSYLKQDNLPSAATAQAIGMRFWKDFPDAEGGAQLRLRHPPGGLGVPAKAAPETRS